MKKDDGEYERRPITCPKAVRTYQLGMGGTDHFDQLRAYYPYLHGTSRWYLRVIFFMLDSAVINGFLNHLHTLPEGHPRITLYEYRKTLARQLMDLAPRDHRVSYVTLSIDHLHMPIQLDDRDRCERCRVGRSARLFCPDCQVPLCWGCFQPFHEDLFAARPFDCAVDYLRSPTSGS
eukprot:gnl/Trimastix_PCT/1663.p2 GENE.gnl/Trimastix_PCT/1663~~gnl/Trimastix_PCT/1663.p2  ORF type:complete len:177 (-),score=4.43 gnl/Trimastix_PCT/1663:513-1043(-)